MAVALVALKEQLKGHVINVITLAAALGAPQSSKRTLSCLAGKHAKLSTQCEEWSDLAGLR